MFSTCPKCQTKLSVEMKHLDEDTAVVCVGCRSVLKIRLMVEMIAESSKPAPSSPKAADNEVSSSAKDHGAQKERSQNGLSNEKKILICIDGEGTRDMIKEILIDSEFKVVDIPSGKEVLSAGQQHHPVAALIDVGLSDVMGTEICAAIKKDPRLKGTVVMLVAAIYDKNARYRRQPDSLFGADDYIERHCIEKELLQKIEKHLGGKKIKQEETPSPIPPKEAGIQDEKPASYRKAAIPNEGIQSVKKGDPVLHASAAAVKQSGPAQKDSKEDEAARRLARIIVSDIVLYNKKKVDEGIRTDTFFDILKEEIEEGRKHYLSRVATDLHKRKDYYKEAFEEFIKKRKSISS